MSQLRHDLPDQYARHAMFLNDGYDARRRTPGPADADVASESYGLRTLQVLRRRWMSIASIVAIGSVMLAIVALLVPPRYTAMAQIEIRAPTEEGRPPGDVRVTQMLVDSQLVRLRARDFLRIVHHSLAAGTPVVPGATAAAASSADELALEEFEQRLTVSQMLSSSIIAIRFTSRDPAEAARVANEIVAQFSDQLRQGRERATQMDQSRITAQIAEVRARMATRRAQLGALLIDASGGTGNEVRALNEAARVDATAMSELVAAQAALNKRAEVAASEVSVVSMASTPVRRSSPHPLLFVVPGTLLLAIGAVFVALSMERLDQGVRSASAATALTAAPCAGLVPRMLPFATPMAQVGKRPFSPYAESVRGIVASLDLLDRRKAGAVVLLSCCIPGERKTELGIAMAQYLGQLGKRVVVVDLDARRPRLAALCAVTPVAGVAAVTLDGRALSDAVVRPPGAAFDTLVMEDVRVDPMELIGSERLGRLLKDLRARYDAVIVDGPVAIGSGEASLLARHADSVVLVVRWGATRQLLVQNAARALRGSDATVVRNAGPVAVVLSDVPMRRHARYRFGDAIEVSLVKSGAMTTAHEISVWTRRAFERLSQSAVALATRLIRRAP